jgi:hypothetical protein
MEEGRVDAMGRRVHEAGVWSRRVLLAAVLAVATVSVLAVPARALQDGPQASAAPAATSGGSCTEVCFEFVTEELFEGRAVSTQTRAATTRPTPREFRIRTAMIDGTGELPAHPWAAVIPTDVPAIDQVITIPANLATASFSFNLPVTDNTPVDRPFELLLTDMAGTVLDRRTVTIVDLAAFDEVGFLEQSEPPVLHSLSLTIAEGQSRTLNISQLGFSEVGPVDLTLVEQPLDPALNAALLAPSVAPPTEADYTLDGNAVGVPLTQRFLDGGEWNVELAAPADTTEEGT